MIRFFNDTKETITVRVNIAGTLPTVCNVEPQREKAVWTKTDEVLVKLWSDNTLMIQDRGEFSMDNLRIRDKADLQQARLTDPLIENNPKEEETK